MTIANTPSTSIAYNGEKVPVYELETINFSELLSAQPDEINKLRKCCEKDGFFYLDLDDIEGKRMLKDHQRLLALMRRFFKWPDNQKEEFGLLSLDHGYEPVGNHTGVVDGTKDGYAILQVSRKEIRTRNPKLPSIVNNADDIEIFSDFIGYSNMITKVLLSCLSTALGLSGEARFETFHRNDRKSNTALGMMRYDPGDLKLSKEIGHQKHTDIGSLTLLFSEERGLQVLPPGCDTWGFVEPRKGHVVVNVGDWLHFASNGRLSSCIHQVVPISNKEYRYSIAFFLRPEDDAEFVDSQGQLVTMADWHSRKMKMFGAPSAKQSLPVLCVGMKGGGSASRT